MEGRAIARPDEVGSGMSGHPISVGGHEILPSGGHVAARWRPTVLPSGGQQNCPR